MDAGQRSTTLSSALAPAPLKRIQERGYFDGYTWPEVFRDPLVLTLTAIHLFFFWFLLQEMKLQLSMKDQLSAQDVVACTLFFCLLVVSESMLHLVFFCNPFVTYDDPTTTASGGGSRGPAGPSGRTTTTTAPSPPAPARIVVDAAAQPVISVFCNSCCANLSLKWCMGLDKYIMGCSCPRDLLVERCIDSSGQRQLRICIPIG